MPGGGVIERLETVDAQLAAMQAIEIGRRSGDSRAMQRPGEQSQDGRVRQPEDRREPPAGPSCGGRGTATKQVATLAITVSIYVPTLFCCESFAS